MAEARIESVRTLIARELAFNARALARYESRVKHRSAQRRRTAGSRLMAEVQTQRWDEFAAEWSLLRTRNPDLWAKIANAYERLEDARVSGQRPPRSEQLVQLVQQLQEAEF
jgi:hypothetical protein